jgi:molybdopterin-guanine dinucleotide biosynthesis protein MobB
MIPVVSIVGKSNVGKTTLIEKLIRELKKRGYKVAVVKHSCANHLLEIDKPGKDTWRHARAGADTVAIASPRLVAMFSYLEAERDLDEILVQIKGVDVILTEGFKKGNKMKIEVCRAAISRELCCRREELLAVAGDFNPEVAVPYFDLNDAVGLVDLIISSVTGRCSQN